MNWLILIIAGILEIGFSVSLAKMKDTSGLLFGSWTASFIFFLFASLWLMYKAIETIPVGTAYAVWTGIGSVGTVIVGILFFKEPAHFWRLFFICTLIVSVIGLKLVSD
ncbi:MAG: multidrug efflux SMR transporter [Bacteroidota bacterium]|nr:multidrug efflux SMR transporter [Bacteroidota bacterium]